MMTENKNLGEDLGLNSKSEVNVLIDTKMKSKKLIAWLLAFLPLIITIIVLPMLQDEIPAHYGLDGQVTRYGSKYEALIIPIVAILFGFFWLLIEKIPIKNKKYAQNAKVLFWSNISISLLFMALVSWDLYTSFTQAENIYAMDIDFMKIEAVCLSIFWIILGIVLPKFKPNWLIGIRTPWTLKNENCWEQTHRFGGKIMIISGIISTLLCLFVFESSIAFYYSIGSLLVIAVILVIYSYRVYKKIILLIMTVMLSIGIYSCDKNEDILKKLYEEHKNGEIDECKCNGRKVYRATPYLNGADIGSYVYDKDGKQIGSCCGIAGKTDPIFYKLKNCEVIYRVGEVDKYGLNK
jgi:uncharacterized membrane protein